MCIDTGFCPFFFQILLKTVDVIMDSSHLGQIVKWASLETFSRYLLFFRFQKWVFFNISLKIEQQRLKNYVWIEQFYIFPQMRLWQVRAVSIRYLFEQKLDWQPV